MRFEKWAKENEVPIQLAFATADIAALAQARLGDLLRAAGKMFIANVMESEVRELAGGSVATRPGAASTNAIESSFSVVKKICLQVKRWQAAITGYVGLAQLYYSPNLGGINPRISTHACVG